MKPKTVNMIGVLQSEVLAFTKEVVHIIYASTFERTALWAEYKDKVKWIQNTSGIGVTVGRIGLGKEARPVVVSFSKATINGKTLLFVDPCSQVVDYQMIENFLSVHCPCIRPDGFLYLANAENAHDAFHHIEKLIKQEHEGKEPLSEKVRKMESLLLEETLILNRLTEESASYIKRGQEQIAKVKQLQNDLEVLKIAYLKEVTLS